jgi:aldehyde:ferredoxin oxidoreductase
LGPMTGTMVIGNGRNAVGAKSPLTGGIVFSQVGEHWGAQLKRAGYDALIIEGKAAHPVYIHIQDEHVDIRDAGRLWGKTTKETQEMIRAELQDEKIRVAQIGPGGENLVRFACIMNGCYDAAGRGGLGAVMGSKNLKAIAVKGHKAPAVSNPECIGEMNKVLFEKMKANMPTQGWMEYGTGGPEIIGFEATGGLSIRNWRDGLFPGINKIHAGIMKDTVRLGMDACFACPLRCKKRIGFREPSYTVDPAYGGPEYETIAALGSNVGIDDMKAMIKGNEMCNAYSLDTISTGGVIAFAMECFEKGLLTTADTGGLDLTWGNTEAMFTCIELIAKQEGFGRWLAEGTAALARRIGRGSEAFAMHVKGVDPGHHEPRQMAGFALGFMINPHGADHCCNSLDHKYASEPGVKSLNALGFYDAVPALEISPRKVAIFRVEHFRQVLYDCLLLCHLAYARVNYQEINTLTAAVTGWDTSPAELERTAERILTMARMFNIREGFTAGDDRLPLRYFQPKTDGLLSGKPTLRPEDMERAKKYYYTLMGWDEKGVPLPEKVEELNIV